MLRNLNKEFPGNELPDELHSRLVRNGAVMHMKNACSPTPRDVRTGAPDRAAEAAAAIGAVMAGRIGGLGVRVIGDPEPPSAVPRNTPEPPGESRIAPEVAVQALYGAPAAAAVAVKGRTVHQTSSKELVRVLGHRCLGRLRRR